MIFLTVGSELPFDRLVKAVDVWARVNDRKDIIGQIADPGVNGYRPSHIKFYDFIAAEDYGRYFDEAELIIGHAGMGSIITAALKNKPIIIMPRKMDYKETRNDHQVATAKRFSDRNGIFIAEDEHAVGPLLETWTASLQPQQEKADVREFAEENLLNEIRNFILRD